MSAQHPRLIVIGGGFAGLWAVRALARSDFDITLIDRCNLHLFQPLLYQVATGGLSAPAIAAPLRHILRKQQNVRVLMAEVTSIDRDARRVVLASGDALEFDWLLVASGATHAYFGNEQWAPWAPGLKTLDDAMHIRAQILGAFERAECASDPNERAAWLNFVVVGAGPTGVELAGTLAEIARHTLKSEFRSIDPTRARVILVEGGPRVLGSFEPAMSAKAQRQLERLGVEVRTGNPVSVIAHDHVVVGDQRIATQTVLWAAGVAASPLGAMLGAPLDRAGRVRVEPDLSLPGYPHIFVAGDHRPHGGGDPDGPPAPVRPACLVVLAGRPRVLPDRLPQPPGGADRLGLGLLDPPTLRPDHRARGAAGQRALTSAVGAAAQTPRRSGQRMTFPPCRFRQSFSYSSASTPQTRLGAGRLATHRLETDMTASNASPRTRSKLLLTFLAVAATHASIAAAANRLPVLLVIANQDFHYADYASTRASLEARGLPVVVAAGEARLAQPQGAGVGAAVRPDLALSRASAGEYSAIVFAGGWGASSYQYAFSGTYHNVAYRSQPAITRDVNRLIGEFTAAGKPVAGICHGVSVLAWARIDGTSPLNGRVVVGPAGGAPGFRLRGIDYPDAEQPARWQIEMNGATMLTSSSIGNPLSAADDVWVDGRIITGQNFESTGRFAELLAQAVATNRD